LNPKVRLQIDLKLQLQGLQTLHYNHSQY
jgi:hypothetical protein